MEFTKVEIADKKYLNYIFLKAAVGGEPITAMFDTKGNSLLKKSIQGPSGAPPTGGAALQQRVGAQAARRGALGVYSSACRGTRLRTQSNAATAMAVMPMR